jgi:riboflavin synthase
VFTGIVQALGRVERMTPRAGDVELEIGAARLAKGRRRLGDSVCVQGVCLTVVRVLPRGFAADVSRETLACTTLGELARSAAVNLEPALRAGDALGGHLVSGHVDGVGRLIDLRRDARSLRLEFSAPRALMRYIAAKGSITVDGVSLTVNSVRGSSFSVNVVPHTRTATTLGRLVPGMRVNLEVDLLARYLERMLPARRRAPGGRRK